MTDVRARTERRVPTRLAAAGAFLATAVALLGTAGRGDASTTSACSSADPAGRLVCITVQDLDGVSPSGVTTSGKQQVDVRAYQFYTVEIANIGGNTLTNGSATLTLTDTVAGQADPVVSTALFVPAGSPSFCSAVSASPNVVRCALPNLPAGASTGSFTVAYRTSTTPGVTATKASVTTAFKEGANQGANPADFTVSETTSLEPDPQLSVAWSPTGQSVRLGTSPADVQFSTLTFKVPADKASFLASLSEGSGSICPTGKTCSTELVRTDLSGGLAQGVFSPQNPFTLTLTFDLGLLGSRNLKDFVIYHLKDDNTLETISARCSASPPASTDPLPCFNLSKVNQQGQQLAIVEIWAWQNGYFQG